MAIRAITMGDTVPYVLDRDPSKKSERVPLDKSDPTKGFTNVEKIEDGATVFRLRALDVFLMAHIYDSSQVMEGEGGSNKVAINTKTNQTNVMAVKFGLAGIDNLVLDDKGSVARITHVEEFVNGRAYQAVADADLKLLDIAAMQELGGKIKDISSVSKVAEKNSDGVSSRRG